MYKKYIKRMLDIILAILIGIVALPIVLIATIALKIEDKSQKVIFKQIRIGRYGNTFLIYKLRTMKIDKKDGENKVTKMGKILRNTSIDELPQLLNIIKGEMSFIGPRPWIPEYYKYFTDRDKRRVEILPGLTGWAQANGRNNLSIHEKIEADIWYVDNITFKTDLKVCYKTIESIFKKTGSSITEYGIQDEINELKARNNNKVNPNYPSEESFNEKVSTKKTSNKKIVYDEIMLKNNGKEELIG